MSAGRWMLAMVLVVVVAVPLRAADGAPEAAVARYLAALAAVESATGPVSLEPLFDAADALQGTLMHIEGDQAWIERLDEAAYSALRARLRGVILGRGLDIYAQPDPDFLLALAQAHGRPADRAFFEAYRRYWTASLVPAYLSLDRGLHPCVRYGENRIAPVYREWREFRARHPLAYQAFATQVVADAEDAVEQGKCTCTDAAAVMREQQDFLAQFPEARDPDKIRRRLAQLQTDPDANPVYCN